MSSRLMWMDEVPAGRAWLGGSGASKVPRLFPAETWTVPVRGGKKTTKSKTSKALRMQTAPELWGLSAHRGLKKLIKKNTRKTLGPRMLRVSVWNHHVLEASLSWDGRAGFTA